MSGRGRTESRRLVERQGVIRACAGECAGPCAVAAEAGIIRVIGVHFGWVRAADGDHNTVENVDLISRQNLQAVTAKGDVGHEIKLAVAARRVKFQYRISRERAAANIERAVGAEYAGFEDVCVSVDVIECDRSVAVDECEERVPGTRDIIVAAVNIDRRGRRPVAA
jgi:hypothetical protein